MKNKMLLILLPTLVGLSLVGLVMVVPAHANQSPIVASQNRDAVQDIGHDYFRVAAGVLASLPEGLVGSWVIDTTTYTATNNTHFQQWAGPFTVGGCVAVKYNLATFTALEIQTIPAMACGGKGEEVLYGFIEQVPAAATPVAGGWPIITGTWVISGVDFISTPQTRLETHHGPLVVGACAKVVYNVVNSQNMARKIESEWSFMCAGPVAFNQVFGTIASFPPDLDGTWVLTTTGNNLFNFMTDPSTLFLDKHRGFSNGMCVWVKYYSSNGVYHAVWVFPTWDKLCRRVEAPVPSMLVATVESMPTGTYTGTWMFAGVVFTATEKTRFETEGAPLAVGDCAEVKYNATGGAMLLYRIEKEEQERCQTENGQSRFKVYGVVEMLPASGTLTGTWQISGIPMEANSATEFEQHHGLLALGAYVSAKFTYDPGSGARTALEIKTHVAPGFGCTHRFGHLEFFKPATSQDGYSTWRIDGVTYLGNPGMEASLGLKIGSLVSVNAYQENGNLIATQVLAVSNIFLPTIRR
jgi:hypothetical protein